MDILIKHKLLNTSQHGFLNARSCLINVLCFFMRGKLKHLPGIVRELRDFWFKFFQKHQIWLICPLWHTVSIFAGRQDERPLAGRHFEKNKMAATSAQTCTTPLVICSFGRRIRFSHLFYDLASRSSRF